MKLLTQPPEGFIPFVLIRVELPETCCFYFKADGDVEAHWGKLIDRKIVFFIRDPETFNKPT